MKICIATPTLDVYSETFIRTHLECLPFEVFTLSGSRLDQTSGGSILRESTLDRLFNYPSRKLSHFNEQEFVSNRQAKWLKSNQIDVVLAEYGFTGLHVIQACVKTGIPVVVHFHGFDAHNNEAMEPYLEAYRKMFAQASAIVGVSRSMISQLSHLGAPKSKLHYIPYFVDPDYFTPVSPPSALPVFLSVGRFVEKKAPHLTLLAFARVLEVVPEARLEMAGDGPLYGACQWQAEALGIEHAVTFHGSKSHQWIKEAMNRVKAFVQHSVKAINGDSEGTPVAVLEAQCSRLPVIATRHKGISDVVIDGKTGFLCEEGDVKGMADAMIRLLAMSKDEYENMGYLARKNILTDFSKKKTIGSLAKVIQDSVNR